MEPGTDAPLFIGLMSGTSLDGVDGVLAALPAASSTRAIRTLACIHIDFAPELRAALLALQQNGADEIHREALAANQLARTYANCVAQLLSLAQCDASQVCAIGAHGQTIRHRPELGYTRQINNGALLAELTGIDVITDFRSRDIAAGGQGAPLVPLFHQHIFGGEQQLRVIVNIGGISNVSVLPARSMSANIIGFDTGPGNILLDLWVNRHLGSAYDADGKWASAGVVNLPLLQRMRQEPFFAMPPPKSTGRDLLNADWLDRQLAGHAASHSRVSAVDVQATLTELTAGSIANAVHANAATADTLYACGGGAFNLFLMQRIRAVLTSLGSSTKVVSTAVLGVPPDQVEALAFAWLAQRFAERKPGNSPSVTGAIGHRIAGALYPR